MKGLILCAGRGTRIGGDVPKILLNINGKTVLEHQINTWKNLVSEFIFVVGYQKERVIKNLPSNFKYVVQEEPKGIADAILKAEDIVGNESLAVILGDCVVPDPFPFSEVTPHAIIYKEPDSEEEVKRSYSVEIRGGKVVKVEEKPKEVKTTQFCGMGFYFFNPSIFSYIKETPESDLRGEVEITDTLQIMIESGEEIKGIPYSGDYLNLTYMSDIPFAKEVIK